MIGRLRTKYSPIGVDAGSQYIKAVQLHRYQNRWHISAAIMYPRTGEQIINESLIDQMRQVFERNGFVGRNIVLATPPQHLRSGSIQLPQMADQGPLAQLSRMELSRIHRMAPHTFEMSHWKLPDAAKNRQATGVMTIACPHEDANRIVDVFENHTLNITVLDAAACALSRACSSVLNDGSAITLIADLGWNSCRIVALSGRTIVYERAMAEAGLKTVYEQLVHQLGEDTDIAHHTLCRVGLAVADSEDPAIRPDVLRVLTTYVNLVAKEITSCGDYMLRQYPDAAMQGLLLTGGGSDTPGVKDHLASALQMEVRSIAPTDAMDCPNELMCMCSQSAMTQALGLASHAIRR